jgi:hypothetical protein
LTRVSVPILTRQQRHLAFISAFSVQMLYLPGLKNVVSPFPTPPESAETVATSAAADPVGSFNFIFTVIAQTSKWMEAVPLSDTSASACAKALIFLWISHFGVLNDHFRSWDTIYLEYLVLAL